MALKKCPRCELNYIREGEKYCDICKRYMKGESDSDSITATCVECGERPAVRGNDLCAICLREARRQATLAKLADDLPADVNISEVDMDDMEVPLGNSDDIPERELEEIDRELGGDMDEDEEDDLFAEEDED
ncbi:MAG: hypothetical protein EOM66_10570 [Clostridia bacterium]|nr:hypothetical protein [Candidatus Pelethousia sp.]NCB31835.1 hypothetical protein [Clostridia bacterium]